ncbi:MAG: hypothetical protein HOO67_04025 [Candidatus Peribacteraceae bacterium]|nr:hypothetical protein [Candidatus Peribacteraceae bacterium]
MTACLLTRAATAILVVSSVVFPGVASAYGSSVSYRNAPGFVCHRWGTSGQCADWSYYEVPPPAYGGLRYTENPNQAYYRYYKSVKTTPYVQTTTPARAVYSGTRCTDPTVDCTGRVSVRASANTNPAVLGDLLTYTIYVRNDDSQNRTVNVRAYVDRNVGFESATYGGYSDGDVIRWDALRIPARSSRSFTLRVRVHSNAPTGSALQLKVQAGNSVDSVSVNVYDSGYYQNSIRVNDDGIRVRYNQYTGDRELRSLPTYYHDEFGNVHTR